MKPLSALVERAGTRRRLTVLSIVGLVLVPFVIAGVLVWALWNPQDRLDTVHAAIVNNDKPVTVNGQTLPLGRELAGGLVGSAKPGSAKAQSDFTWTITDASDAASGLDDGRYSAVITIPAGFSAAATSVSGDAASARAAQVRIRTSPDAKILDPTLSRTIAQTAATTLGDALTGQYLAGVYGGFNTIGTQLGTAADGAATLAGRSGALTSGAAQAAQGAHRLADGVPALQSGASQLASGAGSLATGLQQASAGAAALPGAASQLAAGTQAVSTGVSGVADALTKLAPAAAACQAGDAADCQALAAGVAGLQRSVSGQGLAAGAQQTAAGAAQLAAGLPVLTQGVASAATGAAQLATGAGALGTGVTQLQSGATALATGADALSSGVTQYTGGVSQLSDGLSKAATAIPSYSDTAQKQLSEVVTEPVVVSGGDAVGFGELASPLFAMLALWLGALASFIVIRPVSAAALGSSRSSLTLSLRGLTLPAAIGALQGAAVAGALQPLLHLSVGGWFALAGLAALAAIVFAAVNQALVAVFGGSGRFISMIVILLGLATGIVGTVPGILSTIAGVTPIAPAQHLVAAVVQGTTVAGGDVAALVLWLLIGLAATVLAVSRRRTVPVARLVPAAASARG